MANRYKQGATFSGVTRFTQAPMSEVEFSKMTADPTWFVPFNGGDIVPVYYNEVLPHDTFSIDLDYVARQLSTSLRPTMGKLQMDLYAFFVPNRVINDSWKNVTGENTSGFWSAPEISLAPLLDSPTGTTQIPVGSIADYYGLPTQAPIQNSVLSQMNDLKFKGYLMIYNEYFRDQNYIPPIPFSKLNVYQGFLKSKGTTISLIPDPDYRVKEMEGHADGSYIEGGSVIKAIFGEGGTNPYDIETLRAVTTFSALDKPLKAMKLHDALTSVLPSPQKGPEVTFTTTGELPVDFSLSDIVTPFTNSRNKSLRLHMDLLDSNPEINDVLLGLGNDQDDGAGTLYGYTRGSSNRYTSSADITGSNLLGTVDLADAVGISVNDLRTAIATQQVLEQLARGGSRYWEFIKSFFGIEVDDPFPDIPTQIGHIRRDMDLYQVAQTSASQVGGTTQGSLTAFGYTTTGGSMFTKTFLEHGYIHIFAVVRHRSVYSSYVSPDNFRRNTMDFYLPQFANISEQPVRLATLNPFHAEAMERAIGYQEAWWEYRYEPDRIVGALRSGIADSLDVWHYGNFFDGSFTHVNGEWLLSDTQEILDRTLAITSELSPQFIGMFNWKVTKQRPMPVYSVPGLDMI